MTDSKTRTEQLIELYFEARTTLEEERELAALLAHTEESSPLIDEARAVMGYAAASPSAAAPRHYSRGSRIARKALQIAASVALVAGGSALAVKLSTQRAEAAPRCVAYIDSVKITDEDAVMQMVMEDLQYAMSCSADVDDENFKTISVMAEASQELTVTVQAL